MSGYLPCNVLSASRHKGQLVCSSARAAKFFSAQRFWEKLCSIPIDSFTVSQHSHKRWICPPLWLCKEIVNGLWKLFKIPTGHVIPEFINVAIRSGDYVYFPPQPPGSLVRKIFLWTMTSNSLTENEEHDIPSHILKPIFGLHVSVLLDTNMYGFQYICRVRWSQILVVNWQNWLFILLPPE